MADSIRHLFPGSNTHRGFYGFFENLQSLGKRVTVLKGGPGVGKSSLMRAVGSHYESQGQQVAYYHCSGDPDSLDAVLIPEAGILMLDGTSPHVIDPVQPGAVDGILNLGVCLDEDKLAEEQDILLDVQKGISRAYARAYRYLSAAHSIRSDAAAIYQSALTPAAHRTVAKELMMHVPSGPVGVITHQYVQAVTYKGVLQYLDSLQADKVICLETPWGYSLDAMLRPLYDVAVREGLKADCYYDPLDGECLAHIRIGHVLFTGASFLDAPHLTPDFTRHVLTAHSAVLAFDRAGYDLLVNQAVESLGEAKSLHDTLERYYIDAMDYERLGEIKAEYMKKLP